LAAAKAAFVRAEIMPASSSAIAAICWPRSRDGVGRRCYGAIFQPVGEEIVPIIQFIGQSPGQGFGKPTNLVIRTLALNVLKRPGSQSDANDSKPVGRRLGSVHHSRM
jgi:hypothetical protein